jgi:osmotically-inducible protein OsmY
MNIQDEHLEFFVERAILDSNEVSALKIEVVSQAGVVKLQGRVQSNRRKLAAQQVAEKVDGVYTVINALEVQMPEAAEDLEIARECNIALALESGLMESAIRVDSNAGQVTLSGYVSTTAQLELAYDIISGVNGVADVSSYLFVNPDRVMENHNVAARIVNRIEKSIGFQSENLIISVVDNAARISGTVDQLWKKELVEKLVRQHRILHVCNEIAVA